MMNCLYKTVSDVKEGMLSPDYWLYRDETCHNLRMDAARIQKFNKDNMTKLASASYLYDLAGFSDALRYGVCVRRDIMWDSPQEGEPLTAIYVNEPVIMLDGSCNRIRIRCSYYEGWVDREAIAWFRTCEEWQCLLCMKEYIVVTGDCWLISDREMLRLDMGVKLELETSLENVLSKGGYYNYSVKVPYRDSEEGVRYKTVLMPVSSDVSVGYLPYTGANVVKLAYKTLGNVYGWGGSQCSRDCSSLVMDIHRCFGFIMPRDVSGQMRMRDCRTLRFEECDDWNYLRAGDIVGWKDEDSAHTYIHLGFEGEYYGISAVGGQYRSCIVNAMSLKRDNGVTWKDSVTYAKLLRW